MRDHSVVGLHLLGRGALVGELGNVIAGAEGPVPGPGQDDDPDLRVDGKVVERRREALPRGKGERVAALRAVDGHPHHVCVALDKNLLGVVHGVSRS